MFTTSKPELLVKQNGCWECSCQKWAFYRFSNVSLEWKEHKVLSGIGGHLQGNLETFQKSIWFIKTNLKPFWKHLLKRAIFPVPCCCECGSMLHPFLLIWPPFSFCACVLSGTIITFYPSFMLLWGLLTNCLLCMPLKSQLSAALLWGAPFCPFSTCPLPLYAHIYPIHTHTHTIKHAHKHKQADTHTHTHTKAHTATHRATGIVHACKPT